MSFHNVDFANLKVSKMRGPQNKRFGQVTMGNTKDKLEFQIPGSKLIFEPNEYNSISVDVNDEDFISFLEALESFLSAELGITERIDMGLRLPEDERFLPTFRIKLGDETGYYDEHEKRCDKDHVLKKKNMIHVLLQLHCTYQIDNRLGVSWKARQIRKGPDEPESPPKSPPAEEEEYQFLD